MMISKMKRLIYEEYSAHKYSRSGSHYHFISSSVWNVYLAQKGSLRSGTAHISHDQFQDVSVSFSLGPEASSAFELHK